MSTATAQKQPMNEDSPLLTLPIASWSPQLDGTTQKEAVTALEHGGVLVLPQLPFTLAALEQSFLRPDCVDPKGKSVKYTPATKRIWGVVGSEQDSAVLAGMLQRYFESARSLVIALFPGYERALTDGNTSFRPVEAEGREQSKRHDDTRLHVDAFPSRPNHGERLLRVFCNVGTKPRVWRVGEPFSNVATQYLPQIRPPFPGSAQLLKALKITKRLRSPYDHYMLNLHDRMKFDEAYQVRAPQTLVNFQPGTTWIVYSDQVSHAAMAGQHLLEQTFTLPVSALADETTSPLRTLEALTGRKLT